MSAQWTGQLIGRIHNAGFTLKQVAEEAGLNQKYTSQVMNSDKPSPKARKKLEDALERLIARQNPGKIESAIADSGDRTTFATGAVRDMHAGKGRMDLLPWEAIIEVSRHCEEGALKYGERNCEKGIPIHSLIDSAFRHLAKYTIGMNDEPHLRAAAWNVLFALYMEIKHPEMQDIPARLETKRDG